MTREDAIQLINRTPDVDLWQLEDHPGINKSLLFPSGFLRYGTQQRPELRDMLLSEAMAAANQSDAQYWMDLATTVRVPEPGHVHGDAQMLYRDFVRRYFTGRTQPEGPTFTSDPQCVQTMALWRLDGLAWGDHVPVLDSDECVFEVVKRDADREEFARRGRIWDEAAGVFRVNP